MKPHKANIKTVYFDTNVFDHIHKSIGVTETDLLALRSAIRAGKISILLSVLNLEEALSALRSSPAHAIAELRLILSLVDWQKLVKPANLLLSDDIHNYAYGGALPEPFINLDHTLRQNLLTLENPGQQDINELLLIVEKIKQQKEEFQSGIKEGIEKVLHHAKKLRGWRPTFNDYWGRLADKFVESFAEHEGVLDACQKRGIKGLLEVTSVRLAVGANLSLIYSQTFEGQTPKLGDSRDLQHAVLASAASIFVTQDRTFARLLVRIPIQGCQVIDIRGLLQMLR